MARSPGGEGLGGGHEAGGRRWLPAAPRALAGGGRGCFCRRGTRGLSRDFSAGLRARVRARSPPEPRRRRAAAQAGTGTGCGRTRAGRLRPGWSGPGQGRCCSGDARRGHTWPTCGGPELSGASCQLRAGADGAWGLGRSPCGTARRSPSLGTPRLWRESLGSSSTPFKNSSPSEERAALRIRGALSELISPPLFPRASDVERDGFLARRKVLSGPGAL